MLVIIDGNVLHVHEKASPSFNEILWRYDFPEKAGSVQLTLKGISEDNLESGRRTVREMMLKKYRELHG